MKRKNLRVGDICFPTDEKKISDWYLKNLKIKKTTHFMINSLGYKESDYCINSIKIIPSNRIITERYYINGILEDGGYSIKKKNGVISPIKK